MHWSLKGFNTVMIGVFSVFLLCLYGVCPVPTECSPPIPGCACDSGTLTCQSKLVKDFPNVSESADIHTFLFTDGILSNISNVPYKNATTISIQKCSVTSIAESAFDGLTQLTHLSIEDNHISKLEANTFASLVNLKELSLRDNLISDLPANILEPLKELTKLDLSHNNFTLTTNFSWPQTLESFECEYCKLDSFPKVILEKFSELRSLDLSHNNLKVLDDDSISTLTRLDELLLSSSNITRIDRNAFANIKNLKRLNLDGNNISVILPNTFASVGNTIKAVLLNNNKLTSLREDILPWNNLTTLTLGNNPWKCDCGIAWMDHLKNNDKVDKDSINCSSPSQYSGKNVFEVQPDQFCSGKRSTSAVALGLAIPIIIICLVFIGYYLWQIIRNRRRQTRERHAFKYRSVYGDTVESNSAQNIMT